MKNKYPELWDALALPPLRGNQSSINSRNRPRHSKHEVVAYILIGVFLELVWLVMLVYFLTNMLESWASLNKLRLIQSIIISNLILIIILLAAPFNFMKIRKIYKEGHLVDENNIYPTYPYGVHSKSLNYIFITIGLMEYFLLSYKLFVYTNNAISSEYFYFCILLILLIDIYLSLVGFLYFRQKYISAKLIHKYKTDNNIDPIAEWKNPISLFLDGNKVIFRK